LLAYEDQTAKVEREAERLRKARYEYDYNRFKEGAQFLDAALKDLNADFHTLGTKLSELQGDINTWKKTVASK